MRTALLSKSERRAALQRLEAHVRENEELLTIEEAAQVLRCDPVTVRRMIERGELGALQLGGERGRPVRIAAEELRTRLEGWVTRPAPGAEVRSTP